MVEFKPDIMHLNVLQFYEKWVSVKERNIKLLLETQFIEKLWLGNLMYETRNLSVMLKLMSRDRERAHFDIVEGEDAKIAHTEYFVLNDDFEDILST